MTMLNQQHRMHPKLCHFRSIAFYDNELHTAPGIEKERPYQLDSLGGHLCDLYRLKTAGSKRQKSGSWFNDVEVTCVLKVLKELVEGPDRIPIGIITVLTLYREQGKLQDQLRSAMWIQQDSLPELCCVDGFQGRENEIVVVSTVRSSTGRSGTSSSSSLGFCDDERRVNVLLTRAKRGLVVLGDRNGLSKSSLWSKWLKEASAAASSSCTFVMGELQL